MKKLKEVCKMTETKGLFGAWVGLLGIVILAGLFLTSKVLSVGHVIYGGNDILFWTLPLATYIFFSLMSVGLTFVASMSMIFGIKLYEPIAKRSIFLAITAILAAFVSLLLELGTPWHMFSYMTSPNPWSTLWWMGLLYGVYLVLLLAVFGKMHTGRPSKAINIVLFLVAGAAASALGGTMGLTEARPVFFGEFMILYFLLTALLSGVAAITLVSIAHYRLTRQGVPEDLMPLFKQLGNVFGLVIGVTLIFVVWRTIVGLYATSSEYLAFKYIVGSWQYQIEFWIGLVVPFLMMLSPSVRSTVKGKVVASTLVLLGTFIARMEGLLAGQAHPTGPRGVGMPEFVVYTPNGWEWLVVAFALAVMLLLYSLGERYIKLEAMPE